MVKMVDMAGRVCGDWTVLARSAKPHLYGGTYWDCRCTCGVVRPVDGASLRAGVSRRCRTCAFRLRGENRKGKSDG